jgi:hypothetical protein
VPELPLDHHAAAEDLPSFVERDQLERGFQHLTLDERAIVVMHRAEGSRPGSQSQRLAVDDRGYLGILLRPDAT